MSMWNTIAFSAVGKSELPTEKITNRFNAVVENGCDGSWTDANLDASEGHYQFSSKYEVDDLAEVCRTFTSTNPQVAITLTEEWNDDEPGTTIREWRRGSLFTQRMSAIVPIPVRAGRVAPYDPAPALAAVASPNDFTRPQLAALIKELLSLQGAIQ